jgi:NCS1 nucleoside transporter family
LRSYTSQSVRVTSVYDEVEQELSQYGDQALAIEPGGVEIIPPDARHGQPIQLFWTWMSPNMEFATVGVGILGVLYWGLSFWMTFLAIVIGTAMGSITQAVLSTWGPQNGLAQMVLSRTGFGFLGNVLPAGLNSLTAGIGWFAVNSISGALALHALVTGLPKPMCLLIVVILQLLIASLGHNLIHLFERFAFPVLTVIFVIGAIVVLGKSHPGAAGTGGLPTSGGFLLMVGASFGYAAGWNPYASDYTRYLPIKTNKLAVGLFAGLGVFLSCLLLETAGAGMVSAAGKSAAVDPGVFTGLMPTWLGKLTLLGICIGAIAANAINIYSGSMSFMAIGIKLPTTKARATVALVFAVIGFVLALQGLHNAGENYQNFLLVIAYWIAPWLGVVFTDRLLRRGRDISSLLEDTRFRNWGGTIAMGLGMIISIWLFSNQTKYLAPIPKHHPGIGDLTFEVGFLISAVTYFVIYQLTKPRVDLPALRS